METSKGKPIAFLHFLLINLISFGWICAIPIMVDHLNSVFDSNTYFFKFVLLSTVVGLLTNIFFGRLVDKTSSRFVLSIGLVLNLAFWLVLASSESVYAITAAFILEGASFSALLIARAPYFHELISKLKGEDAYDKLEADAKIGMLIVMFGFFIGSGHLYEIHSSIPFAINALLVLISVFLVGRYAGIKLNEEKAEHELKSNILKDIAHIYKDRNPLFWLVTTEGFFAALTPYLFFVVNLHLLSNGADVIFISYLIAAVYAFRLIGAYMVRNKSSHTSLAISLAVFSILTFSIALSTSAWITSVLFLLGSIFKEYIEIYLIADVTKRSPAHLKGTIRSYSEIISNTGIIAIMLVMSVFADKMASGFWMGLYGILFAASFLMFLLSIRKQPSKAIA